MVYLRNSTLLPIAWKLSGMDNLGDDFSVTVDNGIIEPKTEFALQMHFRAIKAMNTKKIVRLEVGIGCQSYIITVGYSRVSDIYKTLPCRLSRPLARDMFSIS